MATKKRAKKRKVKARKKEAKQYVKCRVCGAMIPIDEAITQRSSRMGTFFTCVGEHKNG